MKTGLILTALATTAALATLALTTSCSGGGAGHSQPDAERGRYLVERVGMCQDCHSARNEKGEFVPERWLSGSPLSFAPTVPMPWAPASKPIAGLPGLDDAQAMTFLTTGELPGGRRPLPPMPEYRFSVEDARDVVAYLRHPIAPQPAPGNLAAAR